jgi:hypothetical protein
MAPPGQRGRIDQRIESAAGRVPESPYAGDAVVVYDLAPMSVKPRGDTPTSRDPVR